MYHAARRYCQGQDILCRFQAERLLKIACAVTNVSLPDKGRRATQGQARSPVCIEKKDLLAVIVQRDHMRLRIDSDNSAPLLFRSHQRIEQLRRICIKGSIFPAASILPQVSYFAVQFFWHGDFASLAF